MTRELHLLPEIAKTLPDTLVSNPTPTLVGIVEALLFATPEPLSVEKLRSVIEVTTGIALRPKEVEALLKELESESANRSFTVAVSAQGYCLRSKEEFAPYIQELFRDKRGEKLSPAATEVLAIIAYKQPITRPSIDAIRGVDSSGIVHTLLERGLIHVVGRQEAPGRPSLYAVTEQFLRFYGLKQLSDLPGWEKMQTAH